MATMIGTALKSDLVRKAGGFAGISGVGWLLDFCVLLILVRVFGVPVFAANLVSAGCAGMFVFFASRRVVFKDEAQGHAWRRASVYLVYTVAVILLASAAMHWLTHLFQSRGPAFLASTTAAAAAAKVVVTPFNLALNFVMARLVNQFRGKVPEVL